MMTTHTVTAMPRLLAPARRMPLPDASALIGDLRAAGLTGRGGGAFPVYRKIVAVRASGGAPVVVANGAEGEPAAAKDKTLLRTNPHLVLDGLQLAAAAVGAGRAVLYLHRDEALSRLVGAAIDERADTDPWPVRMVDAPPRFLAGEESTLARVVEGGPALPRFSLTRAFESGVGGAPTLVQNIETLAHIASIARFGAAAFRTSGTADEPGTMLATVHDRRRPAHVIEIEVGTPLRQLVDLSRGEVGAVLVGGYHGAWIPADVATRTNLSNADLRPLGGAVGAGVVAALPADRCGVVETARVLRYLAAESAGQCGPCFNGLPRIANGWAALARPEPAASLHRDLQRWSGLVEGRGACRHPDGAVRLARSALMVFADEIRRHGRGVCTGTSAAPFLPVPDTVPDQDADWR
jgi:NADH:ubiquinone oxidoreductase subunit F (NADH-binding)